MDVESVPPHNYFSVFCNYLEEVYTHRDFHNFSTLPLSKKRCVDNTQQMEQPVCSNEAHAMHNIMATAVDHISHLS